MRTKPNFPISARVRRCVINLFCMLISIAGVANDGKQPATVSVKGSVPISYYQAFMISLAVVYGIYLIVRAKRRKRNSRLVK